MHIHKNPETITHRRLFFQKFLKLVTAFATVTILTFSLGGFAAQTEAAGSGLVSTEGADNISENSARLSIKVKVPEITKAGIHFGETSNPSSGSCSFSGPTPTDDGNGYDVSYYTKASLKAGTTYYYQACGSDADKKLHFGEEKSFTTTKKGGAQGSSSNPDPQGSSSNPDPQGSSSNQTSIKLANPLGNSVKDIPTLVERILDIVLMIGVPIIALAIIYSGYKFIAAQGNKEKLAEAKQTILYVIIGAAILLAAYAIATAIVGTIDAIRG